MSDRREGRRPRDPFRNARVGGFGLGDPDGHDEPTRSAHATDPAPDSESVSALIDELQAAAEHLSGQLGGIGERGRAAGEHLPILHKLIDLAPPELRQRLVSAATSGLSATRDLADWVLAQMTPEPERHTPEELTITPLRTSPAPTMGQVPTTWILTASVDNHSVTEASGFSVIGLKERHHKRALEIEPGDLIVLYLTKAMSFAGAIRVSGDMFEERTKLWPGQPKNPDIYPWRFPTEPVVTLPESAWIPAAPLATELEHVQKWPADRWTLAFQGQLRKVSEHDATLLIDRLAAAAATDA